MSRQGILNAITGKGRKERPVYGTTSSPQEAQPAQQPAVAQVNVIPALDSVNIARMLTEQINGLSPAGQARLALQRRFNPEIGAIQSVELAAQISSEEMLGSIDSNPEAAREYVRMLSKTALNNTYIR